MQLRLNPTQLEEKRAHEGAVKEIQEQIDAEEDAGKKEVLAAELAARKGKLDSLMEGFVVSSSSHVVPSIPFGHHFQVNSSHNTLFLFS